MEWSALAKTCLTMQELRDEPLESLAATFERALALGMLSDPRAPVAGLVELFLCRAAFESRTEPSQRVQGKSNARANTDKAGDYHPCMLTIMRGFEMISTSTSPVGTR
jgi:hypothetical protein